MTNLCGVAIYAITHVVSGKCYVGSTNNPTHRFRDHRSKLERGVHTATRLQNAWNKYGETAFTFEVIEVCAKCKRFTREQFYVDRLPSFYNWVRTVRSPFQDPKVAKKISKAMMGNQRTKGLVWSAKARANMSKATKGKPRSEAQRAATLESLRLARERSRVNKPGMNWRILHQMEA